MTFNQVCTIAAARPRVWDFLLDVGNVGRCLPGVEDLAALDENSYQGTLRLKIGPISLALKGTLQVETRDREAWHGVMRAEARDIKLGGGVRARMSMDLAETGPAETEMRITLEAHILGKMGEFGQPVMRKKADAMLQDFARRVSEELAP